MIETSNYYILESQADVWKLAEHLRQRAKREINPSQTDEVFHAFQTDYAYYAHRQLMIQPKDGDEIQFSFNKGQWYLHALAEWQLKTHGRVRIVIVKGRQQGISTWTEGRAYWKASQNMGVKVVVLSHESSSSNNIFDMFKTYHSGVASELQPTVGKDNEKQLTFPRIKSTVKVFTAGKKGVGRGQSSNFFHGCLAEGTLILTPQGRVKAIESFNVGDDVVTHKSNIAPISFISSQDKECFEVLVYGSNLPIASSGEHKYLTKSGWKELSELSEGDKIAYPRKQVTHKIKSLPFRQSYIERPQGGGSVERVPDSIEIDYNLGRIVGLYLAEGVIKKQWKSGTPSGVHFAVHRRETERTIEWLNHLSDYTRCPRIKDREDSLTTIIEVSGKSFAMFIESLCGKTESKQLPDNWWLFGEEFVRGLIHGYLSGDGHSSKREYDRRIQAPSIREAITFGMRDALLALDYGMAVVHYREGSLRRGRNEKAQWTLRLSGGGVDKICNEIGWQMPPRRRKSRQHCDIDERFAWLPIKSISPVGIKKVYDFEVEHEDHSYCLPQCATHNSEVAFWQHAYEHSTGIMQSISKGPGSEVYLESTAYGNTGYFADMWEMADYAWEEAKPHGNGYLRCFIPWFWEPTYREPVPANFQPTAEEQEFADLHGLDDEQLQWRRFKIAEAGGDESRFARDYPATPEEAFNSSLDNVLIQPNLVLRARKNYREMLDQFLNPALPAIIGCDVAREGDDATCIVVRQGRVILHYEQMYKAKGSEVASRIVQLSSYYRVLRTFVDNTGGFGGSVLDFLTDIHGYEQCVGVHFSEKAHDNKQFKNIRSEMWWKLAEWLDDGAAVPDSSEMQKDFCAPTYKYMGDQFLLESKQDMKARGIKSPDIGDACALTFAHPVNTHTMSRSYDPQPNEV